MSFELRDEVMRMMYRTPRGQIVDAGPTRFDEPGFNEWLQSMVDPDSDFIFFLVVETTDVFEKEWDFNTYAYVTEEGILNHDTNPDCPAGCHGQLADCAYQEGRKE